MGLWFDFVSTLILKSAQVKKVISGILESTIVEEEELLSICGDDEYGKWKFLQELSICEVKQDTRDFW